MKRASCPVVLGFRTEFLQNTSMYNLLVAFALSLSNILSQRHIFSLKYPNLIETKCVSKSGLHKIPTG